MDTVVGKRVMATLFCFSILNESLKHFVGRRAMNLEKVGDKLIIVTDILSNDRLVDSVQLRTVGG